jgi:hypothetical protein
MVSVATAEMLPAPSLNWTWTALIPPPLLNFQDLLAAKDSQGAEESAPALLAMRIEATPVSGGGSLAWRASVTATLRVVPAPPFMTTVPVGAVASGCQSGKSSLLVLKVSRVCPRPSSELSA